MICTPEPSTANDSALKLVEVMFPSFNSLVRAPTKQFDQKLSGEMQFKENREQTLAGAMQAYANSAMEARHGIHKRFTELRRQLDEEEASRLGEVDAWYSQRLRDAEMAQYGLRTMKASEPESEQETQRQLQSLLNFNNKLTCNNPIQVPAASMDESVTLRFAKINGVPTWTIGSASAHDLDDDRITNVMSGMCMQEPTTVRESNARQLVEAMFPTFVSLISTSVEDFEKEVSEAESNPCDLQSCCEEESEMEGHLEDDIISCAESYEIVQESDGTDPYVEAVMRRFWEGLSSKTSKADSSYACPM